MNKCMCPGNRGFGELEEFIDSLPSKEGELITVLHRAQSIFGYIPREVQEFVADKMKVPLSKVYGIVTFYSFFTMTPKGRYPISVCLGTACYVRGAEDVLREVMRLTGIKPGEVTEDGKFSLDTLRCVGACGLAPVIIVGGKVHGRVEPGKVASILAECDEEGDRS